MRIPDLANNSLPAEEREDGSFLNWLCSCLNLYAVRLEDALDLFEIFDAERETASQQSMRDLRELAELMQGAGSIPIEIAAPFLQMGEAVGKARRRCEIAARDAVMSVYHFGHVVDAIRTNIDNTCPSLRAAFDIAGMEQAVEEYRAKFPSASVLRNGIGHSAENARDRAAAKYNSVKLRDGNVIEAFWGRLAGSRFLITLAGRADAGQPAPGVLATFDLTRETLADLRTVQSKIYDAFAPAVALTWQLPRPPKEGA